MLRPISIARDTAVGGNIGAYWQPWNIAILVSPMRHMTDIGARSLKILNDVFGKFTASGTLTDATRGGTRIGLLLQVSTDLEAGKKPRFQQF